MFIAFVSPSLFDMCSSASCCYASACTSLTFLVCVHLYTIWLSTGFKLRDVLSHFLLPLALLSEPRNQIILSRTTNHEPT